MDGIWRSGENSSISYPEDGHEQCYKVEDKSWWFQHRNLVICWLVQRYLQDGIFCDVGGGNGVTTKALQDRGITAVLVEPGPRGPVNAKQRGCVHVIQSLWNPETVFHGSTDAVGVFDVAEHVADDVMFMQDINVTMKPHGLLFVTVPAYRQLWSVDDMLAGHFRRYTKKSLATLLTAAGFDILYINYFFCPLWLPLFLARTIPSVLGFRKDVSSRRQIHEHLVKNDWFGLLWNRLLAGELRVMKFGLPIPFGTSCIAVARKR